MARHQTSALLRGRERGQRRPEHLTERHAKPPIIELRRATKVYPGGHVALDRVSLRVDRGEFVFLVGPTGCGKSTLIKMLIRELEPTEGEVLIAGRDIATLKSDRIPYLRRRIGTVFQDFKLLPSRNVYDNVAYALQVIGASRSEIRSKVPDALRLVGLADKTLARPVPSPASPSGRRGRACGRPSCRSARTCSRIASSTAARRWRRRWRTDRLRCQRRSRLLSRLAPSSPARR
jgi:ABC-type glutathione transport system ATPase component